MKFKKECLHIRFVPIMKLESNRKCPQPSSPSILVIAYLKDSLQALQ